MNKSLMITICLSLVLVLSFSVVSAGWFSDFWGKITGRAVTDACRSAGGDYCGYCAYDDNVDDLSNNYCAPSGCCKCNDGYEYDGDNCIETCAHAGGDGCTSGLGDGETEIDIIGLCYDGSTFSEKYCVSCNAGYVWAWDRSDCVETCAHAGGDGCTSGLGDGETEIDIIGLCYDGFAFTEKYCVSCSEGYVWDRSNCVETCSYAGGDGCTSGLGEGETKIDLGSSGCYDGFAFTEKYCVSCSEGYVWGGDNCMETCPAAEIGTQIVGCSQAIPGSDYHMDDNKYCSGTDACVFCNSGFAWDGTTCVAKTCAELGGFCPGQTQPYNATNLGEGFCEYYGCWKCHDEYWYDGSNCIETCEYAGGSECFDLTCNDSKRDAFIDGDDYCYKLTQDHQPYCCGGCLEGYILKNGGCVKKTRRDDDEIINETTADCEDEGYSCILNSSCHSIGGNILDYDCGDSLVCCNAPYAEETCAQKYGEICDSDEECSGLTVSAFDLGYGERCCVDGVCEEASYVIECEENDGICRDSCEEDEEEADYDCYWSDVCCMGAGDVPSEEPSFGEILVYVFLGLVIMATVVAVIIIIKIRIKKSHKTKEPLTT